MAETTNAPAPEAPKGLSRATWVTIALTIAPAVAYLCAFRYEAAYCAAFGIPPHLVAPDLLTILRFAATLLGAFGILYSLFNSILFPIGSGLWGTNTPGFHRFYGAALLWFFTCAGWYASGLAFWILLLSLLAIEIVIASGSRLMKLAEAGFTRLHRRFSKRRSGSSTPSPRSDLMFNDYVIRQLGLSTYYISWAAVTLYVSLGWFAQGAARREQTFLVLRDHPSLALIRIYGDIGIFVEYDPSTRAILTAYRTLPLGDGPHDFELRNIGRLDFSALRKSTSP